jgi:hypothetical protein
MSVLGVAGKPRRADLVMRKGLFLSVIAGTVE